MKERVTEKGDLAPRWPVWLGLLAWVGVLAVWTFRTGAAWLELAPEALRGWASLSAWMRITLVQAGKQLVLFVPLGFLAVFSLPPRGGWLDRMVRRWLPALLIACTLAALVRAVRGSASGPFAPRGVLGLVLPWTGCLLGTWAGMAWARGMLARILFLPQLLLLAVLVAGGARALLHLAIEESPASIDMPRVTSADRRHLYDLFAGKNPLKIREGNTVTLRIAEHDLNLLLAWGLSVEGSARKARIELREDQGQVRAAIPLGGGAKFLNVVAHGSVSVREGHLDVRADRLRIGRIEMPRALLRVLAPAVGRTLAEDPRLQPMMERVHAVALQAGQLTVTYGRGSLPRGFVSKLFHASDTKPIDIEAVHAQIDNLLAAASQLPRNSEARFGAAIRTAFQFAQEHAAPDQAAEANRAAVLALGIVLGHAHVETLLGRFLDDPTRAQLQRTFAGTTVRKRSDWPKHFFVSAALTLIAAGNISDASGLLKEEKDSAGGSGFSFGDLLADRAGTTFAQVATRDETSARALQARLAQGFRTDDYFPEAEGLPEGIQDPELQSRYGGVGGKEYARLVAEIERRIAGCPAYAPAQSG